MKKILSILFVILLYGCGEKPSIPTTPSQQPAAEVVKAEEKVIIEDKDEYKAGTIKVGVLLPLTGTYEKVGNEILNAIQLAQHNIKTDNIVLFPYDTKGTDFGAVAAAKEAINEDVNIVLGPLLSTTTKSVAKNLKQAGITTISFSNDENLRDSGIYLFGLSPQQEIERIVSYSINVGHKDFIAMVPKNQYGTTMSNALKASVTAKDGDVVRVEYYNLDGSDWKKNVQSLIESYGIPQRVYDAYANQQRLARERGENPDDVDFEVAEEDRLYPSVILIPESGKRLETLVALIKEEQNPDRPLQIIGTSKWDSSSALENQNLVGGWYSAPDPEGYQSFENNFYDEFDRFPIRRVTSIGYDAMIVVDQVGNTMKDPYFSKKNMTNYQGFKGVDSQFRFLPNGLTERLLSVIRVRNGGVEILDSAESQFLKY